MIKKNPVPPKMMDVLANLKEDIMKNMNCVKVCTVEAYDPATQRAEVRINHKQLLSENPDVLRDYPIVVDCPVYVPGGGGGYISHPIQKGDTGIILFNDRDIERYLQTGGADKPNTFRKHDLSDGLVIVGFRHNQNTLSGISNDQIQVYWTASVNMQWQDGQIVSTAPTFVHNGNMEITGNTEILGSLFIGGTVQTTAGGGGSITFDADIVQATGRSISAGNGATGTFTSVTVVDGIVTGGTV